MKPYTRRRIMAATLVLTCAGAWAGPYEVVETDDTLSLHRDGRVLWTFNHRVEEGKPYFHPLATTRGQNYTDLRPEDHPWHRALWFSWKFINGVNYWEEDRQTLQSAGKTRLYQVDRVVSPDMTVRLNMKLTYAPGDQADAVMEEERRIVVHPPDRGGVYRIDWSSAFTALKDVELDRTPLPGQPQGKSWGGYAGYSIRMNKDVTGGTFANSEGQAGEAAQRRRARWMSYTVPAKGCLLFMDHPDNFNHPSKWFCLKNMPWFSPAVIHDGPRVVKAGECLRLKYRLVVHPRAIDRAAAEAEWIRWSGKRSSALRAADSGILSVHVQ